MNDYMENSNDNDGDDEEDEDDLAQNTSILGTSFNRFAVLQESKSSKKSKKSKNGTTVKNEEDGGSSNGKNDFLKDATTSTESPLSLARKYAKLKIPVDVAYGAALSCLVWSDTTTVASSSSVAASPLLVPSSAPAAEEEEYPETVKGFHKLQKRCFPLLTAIGLEWPGFVSALLVHIVDSGLLTEETAVQDGRLHHPEVQRKLFFLSSWVEYLVSNEFLTFFTRKVSNQDGSEQERRNQDFTLQQLSNDIGYPVAALIDRCTSSFGYNNLRSTSRRLVELFERVLSVKHAPPFRGADSAGVNNPSLDEIKKAPADELASNIGGTDSMSKFTLDQIEAMLGGACHDDGNTTTKPSTALLPNDEDVPNPTSPRTAWVRCKSWEPCAIGTLPGYPL